MTQLKSTFIASLVRPVAACGMAGLMVGQPAWAGTRTAVVVNAGTVVETSPFQDVGSPPVGVAFSLGVSPSVSFESGNSVLNLTGNGRINQYVAHYGNDISGSVGMNGSTRVSAKTSLTAQAAFSSSSRSYTDRLFNRTDPSLEPGFVPPVDFLLPDPSLLGTRTRQNAFNASVGLSHVLSSRDSISLSGGYAKGWSEGASGRDFNNISGQIGYSRRLSAATSVRLGFSAARSNFENQAFGNSTVLSPTIGVDTRLGKRWTLGASVGVSISRIELAPGVTLSSTAMSGSLRLCHREDRAGFCLKAGRAVQPTYLGDTRTQTDFSADYSRRLSENDSISAFASYGRTDGSFQTGLRGSAVDVIGAGAGYSHRFARRLSGVANVGFHKALRSTAPRKTNATFNLGIRYAFGDTQ